MGCWLAHGGCHTQAWAVRLLFLLSHLLTKFCLCALEIANAHKLNSLHLKTASCILSCAFLFDKKMLPFWLAQKDLTKTPTTHWIGSTFAICRRCTMSRLPPTNFSSKGKLKVDMWCCIKDTLEDFPVKSQSTDTVLTPANKNLFSVDGQDSSTEMSHFCG